MASIYAQKLLSEKILCVKPKSTGKIILEPFEEKIQIQNRQKTALAGNKVLFNRHV